MFKPSSRRSFLTKGALAGILGSTSVLSFGKELETAITRTSIQSGPSDLKISDIKCGYIRGGHSLFVKIHTNQGIWGCGEGVDATPGTYHLVKMFGQRLKDKNPLHVNRLFEDIRRSTRHKSGVAVRFPRMARWRTDKTIKDADSLDTIKALIDAM